MIKKRSIRYIYVYINSDIVAWVWSTSYVRGSMHVHGYIGPTYSDTQKLGARTEVTEQLKCSYLCVHNLWVSYWFRWFLHRLNNSAHFGKQIQCQDNVYACFYLRFTETSPCDVHESNVEIKVMRILRGYI